MILEITFDSFLNSFRFHGLHSASLRFNVDIRKKWLKRNQNNHNADQHFLDLRINLKKIDCSGTEFSLLITG